MDYDQVILDEEAGTVYFEDPALSLDVGAVAKGYAAQLTSDTLRENGLDSFLLNAGGNVVCGGKPLDGRDFWVVGVEDLDGVSTCETLGATDLSVVTSGDYQRYYTVDGVRYHHLIDPETLYPAAHMARGDHFAPRFRPGRFPLHHGLSAALRGKPRADRIHPRRGSHVDLDGRHRGNDRRLPRPD